MTREELVRELELLMTKRDAATSFADSVNATNAVSRFANQHLAEHNFAWFVWDFLSTDSARIKWDRP